MANNYFSFKQFTVYQDKCAMKVCTDACLFGSLAAALPHAYKNILDIGTGTGLLSLMIAQKKPLAQIDAVEIDEDAVQQATENFADSPWANRLKVYHTPVQQFADNAAYQYDCMVSNPPFFEDDLKSPDSKRNLALHNAGLTLAELMVAADVLLTRDGIFGILLPYHRMQQFEALAAARHIYPSRRILVKQTLSHGWFRSILFLTRKNTVTTETEIIIKDGNRQYTPAFRELLADYYLQL